MCIQIHRYISVSISRVSFSVVFVFALSADDALEPVAELLVVSASVISHASGAQGLETGTISRIFLKYIDD